MKKTARVPMPSAPPVRPVAEPGWLHGVLAAALFVTTLLLFSRAMGNDFVNYDDPDYVTANEHVKAGLTAADVRWALQSDEASNWHPLTWMSHQLDATLFGITPRGHHATSVLWHALNAALAFLAFRKLTGALWTSAVFAAFFAWHPLRVESVAWVAERKDVLSGFFWFVTLWAYAAYVERRKDPAAPGAGRATGFYALALGAFALGLTAKPMLVTLPCVLLLLDVWPLRRIDLWPGKLPGSESGSRAGESAASTESIARLVVEKLPFVVLALGSSWITYLVQKSGGSVTEALGRAARLKNAIVAVVRYLGKLLWPVDLAVLYPHPGDWPDRKVIACLVIVIALSGFAVWQCRRRPWIAIGWLWFLGTLVPVIGIVQVGLQSMADRYTYLPMLGLLIALLWTVRERATSTTSRKVWAILAVAGLVACAARTWNQIGFWRNSETLFTHAIEVTEKNYVAHDNRGLFLYQAGRVDEAMADYRCALAISPRYMNANNNLGNALYEQGRPAEALPFYRMAFEAQPGNLEMRNNLANTLSDLGQLDESMQHYEFVLARRPNHVNALNGSAVVLAMRGDAAGAKARLERSLQIDPANASAHNNLGNVCSMLGLRDEAVRHYLRAAELNPREPHTLVIAATILCQQEKFAEAEQVLRRAIAARPVNPDAHAYLGLALAQLGRRDEALQALRTALQQKPDFAQAKAWLDAASALPGK